MTTLFDSTYLNYICSPEIYYLQESSNNYPKEQVANAFARANAKKPSQLLQFLIKAIRLIGVIPFLPTDMAELAIGIPRMYDAIFNSIKKGRTEEETARLMARSALDIIRGLPLDGGLPIIEILTGIFNKQLENWLTKIYLVAVRGVNMLIKKNGGVGLSTNTATASGKQVPPPLPDTYLR